MSQFDFSPVCNITEDQLEAWFDHLDIVFEKTPRQYFVNHWLGDPDRSVKDVWVVMDNATQPPTIASTVRLFRRETFVNGQPQKTGAIGEVSTKKEYQCQGLSTRILDKIKEVMKSDGTTLSVLHSSAKVDFYAKRGWLSTPKDQTKRSLSTMDVSMEGLSLEDVDVSDRDQASQLCSMHNEFTKKYNGTFKWSEGYLSLYIGAEMKSQEASTSWIRDESGKRIAFLFLAQKKGRHPDHTLTVRNYSALPQIDVLRGFTFRGFPVAPENHQEQVVYPTPLFEGDDREGQGIEVQRHVGMMVHPLSSQLDMKAFSEEKNVFWDADGF
ncbi:GCN5-like N-acetyltransferase [Planoprotostelium fungivorum]|uniref:GCN5-like N-acetyltransferase n=1 Tax=Planoprotostelium fungivorum TaxID=1890364 RepID=A0A2P6NBS2_9EUKA|nr:GCN5-like N-acetyltransferase [Planoprotostelium fungivorum]